MVYDLLLGKISSLTTMGEEWLLALWSPFGKQISPGDKQNWASCLNLVSTDLKTCFGRSHGDWFLCSSHRWVWGYGGKRFTSNEGDSVGASRICCISIGDKTPATQTSSSAARTPWNQSSELQPKQILNSAEITHPLCCSCKHRDLGWNVCNFYTLWKRNGNIITRGLEYFIDMK